MAIYDLCVITRNVERLNRTHLDVARAALEGGATMIQLREKNMATDEMLRLATSLRELAHGYRAVFIVNDRVDVAFASEADGVHLGADDIPIPIARHMLGPDALIGATVSAPGDARQAEEQGASYLGVGPVYPTLSKADSGPAIGAAPLTDVKRLVSIPVLAIGGISCANTASVIRSGADGVAVISAVADAPDMVAATAALLRCVRSAKEQS